MEPVELPFDALEPATLRRLVEEYLTREGHEFASTMQVPLERQVDHVIESLRAGRAILTFDTSSGTATVRSRR